MAFCSRCTGFYGALFLAAISAAIFKKIRPVSLKLALMLILPAVADFLFDIAPLTGNANPLRLLSGILAGTGITLYILPRLLLAVRR